MSPVDWEEIGWIDVDAAGVAFCTEGTRLSEPQINWTDVVEDGSSIRLRRKTAHSRSRSVVMTLATSSQHGCALPTTSM